MPLAGPSWHKQADDVGRAVLLSPAGVEHKTPVAEVEPERARKSGCSMTRSTAAMCWWASL